MFGKKRRKVVLFSGNKIVYIVKLKMLEDKFGELLDMNKKLMYTIACVSHRNNQGSIIF
jgi:hypothetical protein